MNDDRINPDDAERILRDAAAGPRPGQDSLTAFLAAAAAPGRDDELAGEGFAVAAFRQAHAQRAEKAQPASRRRPMIARVLTVKAVVALAVSAMAIGGVAVAAGTGTLPGPLGNLRPVDQRSTTHPPETHPATTRPANPYPSPAGGSGSSEGSPAPSSPGRTSSMANPGNKHGKPEKGNKGKGKGRSHAPGQTKKPGHPAPPPRRH